ncbi:SoxR reducing system RseC family protein [Pokkaliibacter sp. CJK22405]|uniref:SoxR reducing system RseC family protein n=1 Tax=Pokkaliibacter sp. CJK22405 TaxID=3384615 RepID=UPI0039851114
MNTITEVLKSDGEWLEESGWVVSLSATEVEVETTRRSTCGACKLKSGCGQGLLNSMGEGKRQRMRLPLPEDMTLSEGDEVRLGLRPDALLRMSLMVYILPLLGLFIGLGGATFVGLPEGGALVIGLLGLGAGFLYSRRISGRCASGQWQPVILDNMTIKNGSKESVELVPIRLLEGKGR